MGGVDLVNGTRNKNSATQEKLVKEAGFEIPNLIDVVVSVLLHNLETGDLVYPDASNGRQETFTRVQEQSSSGWPVMVGGFSALGLCVDSDWIDDAIGASYSGKSIGT